jgi:hypothetical protein
MQACAQVPCAECGRTFRADRIAKHTQVCRTTTKKLAKRKVFDVGKQRVEVGHRTWPPLLHARVVPRRRSHISPGFSGDGD